MKIVTAVVNNPDFIEIQYHTLNKFFKGPYEFIVFNDAKDFPDFTNEGDITIKNAIENTCKTLGIQCINVPNEQHKTIKCAATRCADSMNYILKYQLQNPDKYLLLDSDMFLIDDFDIDKYSKYDCAIVLQSRNNHTINYFWNGIYYFDFNKMKNTELLNWNTCTYCDVGGMMREWLSLQLNGAYIPNTDEIRWTNNTFHSDNTYFIKHLWSCSWDISELPSGLRNSNILNFLSYDIRNKNDKFFCEIYDDVFLHYRAGGNWNGEGMNIHKQLTQSLKTVLLD
jgi:hypothetical protein|uniref:Nucleotide-diphospho-sugar transferase domain-containing protein n=1 Tax=viral metagenome TaxID=1070528 RepID=A0A6C0LSW2_9ZZZZ